LKTQIEKLKSKEELTDLLLGVVRNVYESREKSLGKEVSRQIERYVYLSTIDKLWIDHLTATDDLRDGIGLRGYAQRDPLVEYKKEAFEMFEKLVNQIDYEVIRKIFRIQVMAQPQPVSLDKAVEKRGGFSALSNSSSSSSSVDSNSQPIHSAKIGRNDPCWCGSGKKWKKCHYPDPGPTA
ncbi:MAG: SEC-C metal-binding domain-containing protein, partial [Microgenomates group bacterium]